MQLWHHDSCVLCVCGRWEDDFEHIKADQLFNLNLLTLAWMPGEPMPTDLVAQIVEAVLPPAAALLPEPEPEPEPEPTRGPKKTGILELMGCTSASSHGESEQETSGTGAAVEVNAGKFVISFD